LQVRCAAVRIAACAASHLRRCRALLVDKPARQALALLAPQHLATTAFL
jgi:hypothetical protein